jgi:Cys-rich protein (TIGR01571 family)
MKKASKEAGGCSGCCGYCMTYLGCCCAVHRPGRLALREAYGLEEGTGCSGDFCASWCCSWCGLCQEAREIKARGKND